MYFSFGNGATFDLTFGQRKIAMHYLMGMQRDALFLSTCNCNLRKFKATLHVRNHHIRVYIYQTSEVNKDLSSVI